MSKYLPDFRQGDTWRFKIKFPAGTILTDYKFWLTLKASFDATDVQAVLQVEKTAGEAGDAPTDPTEPFVYVTATATATALVAAGKYYYDVQMLTPSGEITTLFPPAHEAATDLFVVAPQATKDAT